MIELFPISTEVVDDVVTRIGGVDINALVEEYGTPLYLYDAATVQGNYSQQRILLDLYYPESSRIAYAAKAYLSYPFARKIASLGSSIDVVSAGELELALRAGFKPGKIHLHGNNKSNIELQMAIENDIESIVVDSIDEFQYLEELCHQAHKTPRIWLRINPSIAVNTHKAIQTGHSASKFGIPMVSGAAAQAIEKALASKYVRLTGIHCHLGSQVFEPGDYVEAVRSMMKLCKETGWNPGFLSPGGGWGVPYTINSPSADPAVWIRSISLALVDWCASKKVPLPKLIIEPGRWLAARAGVSVYRVGACKSSLDGDWIAALDGGMADNPRPALYGSGYCAELLGNKTGREIVPTRLVGRFCESGDELIQRIDMPRLKRGDLVAVPVSGAYQLSMSSNYNLADRPCVLWLENGRVDLLQKREKASESAWWLGD